jgi:hypothetical protein
LTISQIWHRYSVRLPFRRLHRTDTHPQAAEDKINAGVGHQRQVRLHGETDGAVGVPPGGFDNLGEEVNGKIAKGHGYYLQHAKETCLVGVKGDPPKLRHGVARDVIFSDRRGQSQKPEEVYEYIEELVPNGYYLEIFGRRNNLRDRWVTIGNEI